MTPSEKGGTVIGAIVSQYCVNFWTQFKFPPQTPFWVNLQSCDIREKVSFHNRHGIPGWFFQALLHFKVNRNKVYHSTFAWPCAQMAVCICIKSSLLNQFNHIVENTIDFDEKTQQLTGTLTPMFRLVISSRLSTSGNISTNKAERNYYEISDRFPLRLNCGIATVSYHSAREKRRRILRNYFRQSARNHCVGKFWPIFCF